MGFLSDGKIKEIEFKDDFIGENKNMSFRFSDEDEDIKEHWDIEIDGYKYDVKGLKKVTRNDYFYSEDFHFIELKNVNGDNGWLFGDADYFAFETNYYWVIVNDVRLKKLVKDKCKNKVVKNVDESLYCLYKRKGRDDLMTMFKTIDLMVISETILSKKKSLNNHVFGDSVYMDKKVRQHKERLFSLLKPT